MFKRLYHWVYTKASRPEERGEYSSGRWQDSVRTKALELCDECNGKMLEVGCGEGLFLARLAEACPEAELYGVDIWQEILDKARKRFADSGIEGARFARSDAGKMPYADAFFDTIICVNVFFNLPDGALEPAIKEIARVSKPGARIIFDIRNSLNPLLRIKYGLAKYYDPTVKDLPLKTYSLGAVTKIVARHGLNITMKAPVGFPGNNFAPIFVLEARKG